MGDETAKPVLSSDVKSTDNTKPKANTRARSNAKPKVSLEVNRPNVVGRIFNEDRLICHDLFKLKVASMKKNMMWHPIDPADYVSIEHVHFFHTYDSAGKKQIHSTSVGGHFHIMEIEEQGDGLPPVLKCASGPKKYVRRKNKYGKNKYEKVIVDVNPIDNHTHEVVYLQSNEQKVRKMNEEAAKLIGANARLAEKPKDLDVR